MTELACKHPCGCTVPCTIPCVHGPRCINPPLPKGFCAEHGCSKCGGVILADTENWEKPLCYECWCIHLLNADLGYTFGECDD